MSQVLGFIVLAAVAALWTYREYCERRYRRAMRHRDGTPIPGAGLGSTKVEAEPLDVRSALARRRPLIRLRHVADRHR